MHEEIIRRLAQEGFENAVTIKELDGGIDNKNYLIRYSNGQANVLKVYHPGDEEEIAYETEVLQALARLAPSGFFPQVLTRIFTINSRPSVVLSYASGHTLSEQDIELLLLQKIARLQAHMHIVLANYTPQHHKFRFPIFDFSFVQEFLPGSSNRSALLQAAIAELQDEAARVGTLTLRKTIIHEDLSLDNIVLNEHREVQFIDFSDAHNAELISDVATAIKELIVAPKGFDVSLIKAYLESYSHINPLSHDELRALPYLLKRRTAFMLAYLSHKLNETKTESLKERIELEEQTLTAIRDGHQQLQQLIEELII